MSDKRATNFAILDNRVSGRLARNILTARFFQDESATHLLFVDDDIGFQPALVDRLLKENQPVTATFCPHRSIDPRSIAKVASDSAIDLSRIGSIAASYVAAGNIEHNDVRFEPTSTGSEFGEDISFCRRWTSIGGEILASIDDEVTQVGRLAVRGRIRDQLDHFDGLASF